MMLTGTHILSRQYPLGKCVQTFGAPQLLNENSDYYFQMDFSQPRADAEVLVADNTSVETNDAKLTHSVAFTFICATRSLLKMSSGKKIGSQISVLGQFCFHSVKLREKMSVRIFDDCHDTWRREQCV